MPSSIKGWCSKENSSLDTAVSTVTQGASPERVVVEGNNQVRCAWAVSGKLATSVSTRLWIKALTMLRVLLFSWGHG